MRRQWKRGIAVVLAAAMMTSLIPQGSRVLQQEAVYAAETGAFFVQEQAVTSETITLGAEEDWSDNKPIIAITESVSNTKTVANFDMTANITIDQAAYQSLETEGNYLKLQGVVKIGTGWTWTDSQDIPYLTKDNFVQDGEGYKTDIAIKFRDIAEDDLKAVYFVVVGKNFSGNITFANTTLTPVEVATATEVLAYTCEETKSSAFDFSSIAVDADEDWTTTIKQIDMETGITGASITENAVMRGKATIDEATYNSLAQDGSYIKLQMVMKLGADCTWTQGGDYPYLDKNAFTKNAYNTYSVGFESKFSGTIGGDLREVIIRVVGKQAKGKITISDVNIYNQVAMDEALPEKEPMTVEDFDSYTVGAGTNVTGWKNESGWKYDNTVTPIVEKVNGSNALKLNLDYTANSGESWSEAKVNKYFETGFDVSAYNVFSYDIIYPDTFTGFKTKVFAKNTKTGNAIIDKEGMISDEVTLSAGIKKATVTVKFSPNTEMLDNVTIGTIGVNSAFQGDVYIDNIRLSQYDASADYVEITATPNNTGTTADISGMSTTVSLADADATNETLALYAYLQNLDKKNQVLFGHQNDTHKSVNTNGSGSDTKDITGSISGVVGIDSLALTGVELGLDDTDAAVAKAIEIGQKAAKEGAILTLSTHMPNMSNSKIVKTASGYDFSACDFEESKDLSNNCAKEVLPGGKYNAQFTAYLDIIAAYANGLVDENGKKIPVLFRPFHECDGGWFWWGNASTDDETYKALFRYMEDYLNEKDVNNFIYVFSPGGPVEAETYLNRYPGDDYVDVLAFDYYDDYSSATAAYSDEYIQNLSKSCATLKTIATEHGKVAAIGEAGVRVMKADGSDQEGILVKNNPIKGQNWYKKVSDVARDAGMSYLLLWANFSDTNFYIPYKYNDTKGQELINEFIEFYNDSTSVFADGTNFYGNADQTKMTNANKGTSVSGYITSIISKEIIKEPTTLKAVVKNAQTVKFVLTNGDTVVEIPAVKTAGSNSYSAEVTAEHLQTLGKTDVGTISLVADSSENALVTLKFISFGKEKDVLPANVIEDFELYYGDDGYLGGCFSENSAAGCSSVFTLDESDKSGGAYGGVFTYTLKNTNSEVWTGRIKGELTNHDFSGYNALQMWVKPDGKGQKLVVQLTDDSGEEFEVYLTDFVKGTKAQYVTIPFSSFVGKNKGTLNISNIQKFAVWCNSVADNTNITSSIGFDDIRAVYITASEIASKDGNGLVITDDAIGSSSPNGNKVETTVIENAGKNTKVEVTTTTSGEGKVTVTANVVKTGTKVESGTKGNISAAIVAKITQTAGTKDVEITQKVVNTKGKTVYTVIVNAKDLVPGSSLKIVKFNPKTGECTLVNKTDYKVTDRGGINLTMKGGGTYKLITQKAAKKVTKEILATVKVKNSSKTVAKGKKTSFSFGSKLNMANVSQITYSTANKSVVKVDKNGKITAKKAGTAIVKAKVTLKNGKTKTVTMKVKVK